MNSSLLMILLLIVLMYFMMVRPQKKRQEKQKELLASIKPGDEVVTIGGLHAKVVSVSEDHKTIALDADGSFLTYEMSAVRTVEPIKTDEELVENHVDDDTPEEVDVVSETEQLIDSADENGAKAAEKQEDK
ncbi:preprotein translocase subunit YajC [Weissella viridescens]|uniref:preprotein translocase subunit YajC n=1 Tax=Weissella viridescens TaxID=1629 RepID=UPI001D0769B9|nr:preprotein translocase subunit YajC [Weissella viridescens]MCB6840872.1 preprotein translocase subunit YajC [Weissella viridescens]MCB6847605.1 preprotein translocase subunit YajC [Weissella viridescens]